MYIKCTMLFEATTNFGNTNGKSRQCGWSESYYTAPMSSNRELLTSFHALCTARARLLPAGALIVGQRYQQVDPVGSSSTGAKEFPGMGSAPADYPGLSMYLRIPAVESRNFSPISLRGMPDARIELGEYHKETTYNTSLVNFLKRLNSSIWRFRGRDLSQTAFPLISIADNGTFVTEGATTLLGSQMVRVLRTNLSTGKQKGGRYKISSMISSSSGILLNWDLGDTTEGKIRLDVEVFPQYGPMLDPKPRIVSRKVGRPFTGFRGRASKKS